MVAKLSPCHWLQNFLLNYRSTVHATTGESPASLFLGRQIRTRFDLLHPNLEERVSNKQAAQKRCHDQCSHVREFSAGDRVLVKDKSDWIPGAIIQRLGPLSYLVKLGDGRTWRRHIELMKLIPESDSSTDFYSFSPSQTEKSSESAGAPKTEQSSDTNELSDNSSLNPTPCYPLRVCRPPERFSDTLSFIQ